jgi:geranylgeranyl reductase family protein
MTFDVAIVGGGPAGATAARVLARSGARVAIIDGSHPREKPCGGGITGRGLELAADAISGAGIQVVEAVSAAFESRGRAAAVPLPQQQNGQAALGIVSRREFDAALLLAARRAGAAHVDARATGIESRGAGWAVSTPSAVVHADWLLGADGTNSLVRRRVARPFSRSDLSIASGYFVRGASGASVALDFDDVPTGYLWSFPRADHLAAGACAQATAASSSQLLARTERWIREKVLGRYSLERYSWPIPSLTACAIAREQPAGDRWMLAGDAAGLVDPITREGIFFALLSGEHAAASLGGDFPAAAYTERLRDTAYPELAHAARLKHHFFRPELLTLLVRALARNDRIRTIMADLIAGRQSYAGLRRRLLGTLDLRLIVEWLRT